MSIISLNSEESIKAAKRFETHAETVLDIINDTQNMILNGLPGWQGAAKEAFVTQFAQIKPHLQQFMTLAEGQAHQLTLHTTNVEETDNYSKQQFGAY